MSGEELIGGLVGARIVRPRGFAGAVELVDAPLRSRRFPARVALGFELCVTRNHEPTQNLVEGHRFAVPTGSLLVVEPGAIWQAEGRDAFRSLELAPELYDEWWQERLRERPRFAAPFFNDESRFDLAAWFERKHSALSSEPDALAAHQLLASILERLLRYCALGSARPAAASSVAMLERVRELLHAEHAERLSLADIAKRSNARVGTFQLLRSFQRRFGLTPHRYQRLVRLAAAQQALRQGKSCAETALAVGFYDQAHFTHAFARVYGISPGAFGRGQPFTRRGGRAG